MKKKRQRNGGKKLESIPEARGNCALNHVGSSCPFSGPLAPIPHCDSAVLFVTFCQLYPCTVRIGKGSEAALCLIAVAES